MKKEEGVMPLKLLNGIYVKILISTITIELMQNIIYLNIL